MGRSIHGHYPTGSQRILWDVDFLPGWNVYSMLEFFAGEVRVAPFDSS
jgi:hypothetical protein